MLAYMTCCLLPPPSRCPAPASQSLVLDLRDNRGGLVSEGLEVARLFLEGEYRGAPAHQPVVCRIQYISRFVVYSACTRSMCTLLMSSCCGLRR